jgi:hypothetical protein
LVVELVETLSVVELVETSASALVATTAPNKDSATKGTHNLRMRC